MREAPPVAEPSDAAGACTEVAGPERTVVLEPDFEAVTGLTGHSHKPERAWHRFAALDAAEMPVPLARAVELAVSLVEGAEPTHADALRAPKPGRSPR